MTLESDSFAFVVAGNHWLEDRSDCGPEVASNSIPPVARPTRTSPRSGGVGHTHKVKDVRKLLKERGFELVRSKKHYIFKRVVNGVW